MHYMGRYIRMRRGDVQPGETLLKAKPAGSDEVWRALKSCRGWEKQHRNKFPQAVLQEYRNDLVHLKRKLNSEYVLTTFSSNRSLLQGVLQELRYETITVNR